MSVTNKSSKSATEKVVIFRSCFSGLPDVYGTYNPTTGRARQVKKPVTTNVILDHLKGDSPYGVYLLVGDRTHAIVVDFDISDSLPPTEFVNKANHYLLPAHIETSKSKGYHVWIFFNDEGVKAFKARLVVKFILEEIGYPNTEIFPKQDFLDSSTSYGNFINSPLFGGLVPKGKTVFVDPSTFNPYPDQWAFLESVKRVDQHTLDDIIAINNLTPTHPAKSPSAPSHPGTGSSTGFSLPPCAKKMLQDGVTQFQRVSCFRLAVHFKRLGLPYDVAIAGLKIWALKNRPKDGKGVISNPEILDQTKYAYDHSYAGYGCNSPAIKPFCDPLCPVNQWKMSNKNVPQG